LSIQHSKVVKNTLLQTAFSILPTVLLNLDKTFALHRGTEGTEINQQKVILTKIKLYNLARYIFAMW